MGLWKHRHNWIPLAFLLVGLVLVLQLAIVGKQNDDERIGLETRITAEQLKLRLESCFNSRANLVRTLASYPWQSREQIISDWPNRASTLLPLYSGVQALNYVDPDGIIRVVYPLEPNRAALGADLRQHPDISVARSLERAEVSDSMTRTAMLELLQGGKGFALYLPIRTVADEPAGFVNGVFRVNSLMSSCLPEGRLRENFAFALIDNGGVFYQQLDPDLSEPSQHQVELQIDITGAAWRFTLAPLERYLAETAAVLEKIWITLGVLLISLFTLVLRFALLKQRDIEKREDEYRLLVENQTDLVVKVNAAGDFQYVSPSYCEMFGMSEEQLLGKAFMPLVHEDDRELTARSLERLQQAPHTAYHEQRAMTKDGWRWLAWSNRAVLDDNGDMVGITAVGRDVTDIKRLEKSIAHSQKMRAMGEMAGGITHDFNNLLQVVLGNIEILLLDDRQDQKSRTALESVRDVAMRAMGMTKKLATLSKQDLAQPEVFDVNDSLKELEILLVRTLPASVDLHVRGCDAPLPVLGDRSQLEQVLLNLCFNARDAVESKGRVHLWASLQTLTDGGLEADPQLRAGNYAVVSVEDNGEGIEAEVLPRIFDPFFTTKGNVMGTGLGLANSYSIVQQHKGAITAESTPGEGSCFSVYLPLVDAEAAESEPLGKSSGSAVKLAPNEGGLVLIADDNPSLRVLACEMLEKAGYRTCVAADGQQALELYKARKEEIRLLLLDLVMPEMSGQEVAAAVREMSDDVRILFVSGYVPEETIQALDEPILRKPYTIHELMTALADLD